MHRYNPISQSANPANEQRSVHNREGSLSSSEASSYPTYLHDAGHDSDNPDDPHLALTSQTLNADGTPKRPMNAFMIFARKRRPEISAANQMMRTGDISKILSKEWNTMAIEDKKFYLDQAKKLKDNFNNRYPDYVYRRRPNNTRRKRKSDSDQHSPTASSPTGDTDDASMDETSPIDQEYLPDTSPTQYYSRSQGGTGSSSAYDNSDTLFSPQNPSPYTYTPDMSSGQYNPSGSRMSSLSTGYEAPLSSSTITPLRIPSLTESSGGSSAWSSAQTPASGIGSWDSGRTMNRADQGRTGASNWPVLPALDTSVSRQRHSELGAMSTRSEAFSPVATHRSASSAASSSSGASASHYSNSPFPTLSSPFSYPAQSPNQRGGDIATSPTSHHSGSPEYFPSSQHSSRGMTSSGRGTAESGGFTQSQTLPPPTSSAYLQNPQSTPSWNSPYTRLGQPQRGPSIQPLSPFPIQSASGTSPSSTNPGAQSALGYWDTRKYDGR
ncbi:hypothetical protein C8Q75DRAFT_805489 [Abortiporus biennis]|nr:hypothetical protein C8Q75DRAFT_805489 [Abortiporus biennis]